MVLKIFLVLFLAPTLVLAEQRRGFIVNWTSQKLLVVIVSEIGGAYEPLIFELEAVESMGKGNYLYHPPNVAKLRLEEGDYRIFYRYVSDSKWKTDDVNINGTMPLPFELDIETE